MLTFLIGFLVAFVFGLGMHSWLGSWFWTPFAAMLGFVAAVLPLNLWMKRRLEKIFNKVQNVLQGSQDALRRKANQIQKGFSGSPKAIQRLLEKEQEGAAEEALQILDEVRPLYKWNVLAERQANTVRGQLCYQLKRFDDAERYLKKGFVLDAFTLAMKLARAYTKGDKTTLDKDFAKGIKRFKGEKGLMLYGLYSWILVKENRIDEAVVLLSKGKAETENEVLKANWEHLANGRVKNFTNAGLGDQWYALHLETPKIAKARQRQTAGPWFR